MLEGVEDVARPEHFEAAFGEIGGEDAEEDVVLGEHEGVYVGAQDGSASYGGEDGCFAGGGGDAEDAVGGLSTDLEIEVVGIARYGIGSRMSGCQGSFQIRMKFVMFCETDRLERSRVQLLKNSIVRFEPHAVHSSR